MAAEAEEEEVDVEGGCDQEHWLGLKSSAEEEHGNSVQRKQLSISGILHPGSTSFSSDYCDPNAWLLDESVWSLDHCGDEKSRATIQKMILEEEPCKNVYARCNKSETSSQQSKERSVDQKVKKPVVKLSTSTCQGETHRKPWTKEEQELFEKGLLLYGRRWTRISSIIPSRTSLQVKNYANQYFRNKQKKEPSAEAEGSNEVGMANSPTSECGPNLRVHLDENAAITKNNMVHNTSEDEDDVEVDIDGPDCEEPTALAGRKLSPDEVYSTLLRAATEDKDTDAFSGGECSENTDSTEDNYQSCELSYEQEEDKSSEACLDNSEDIQTACHTEQMNPAEKFAIQYIDGNTTGNTEGTEDELDGATQQDVQTSYSDVAMSKDILSVNENSQNRLPHVTDQEDGNLENSNYTGDGGTSILEVPVIFPCDTAAENVGSGLEQSPGSTISSIGDVLSSLLPDPLGKGCGPEIGMEQPTSSCLSVAAFEQVCTSDREQPVAQMAESTANYTTLNISRDSVLAEEKIANMEFFLGRSPKTPERYMKIRNYILDAWEQTKPSYLYKTSLRTGLKNCGDVNSIGRVHSFLEDIGAINVGCPDRPVPRVKHRSESDELPDMSPEVWANSLRPRKRKVRSEQGDWIDESDSGGLTIEHLSTDGQVAPTRNEENIASQKKRSPHAKHSYDPFQLIPCRKFPSPSAVPFEVTIQSNALVIMDIHAHLSTTEVIGLLGGTYCHQRHTLQICEATPCCSISTGMQCEMDPVSQTQACEHLAGRGCTVVGWYHSHPRFAASPSVRDIETQAKFQEWFAKGGSPFIGIIVSPYNHSNISSQSQIRCLTISSEWSDDRRYRIPYQFDYRVSDSQASEEYRLDEISTLMDMYHSYPFRVQLSQATGQFAVIDKLLESIRGHMHGLEEEEKQAYLIKIRYVLLKEPSACLEEQDITNS